MKRTIPLAVWTIAAMIAGAALISCEKDKDDNVNERPFLSFRQILALNQYQTTPESFGYVRFGTYYLGWDSCEVYRKGDCYIYELHQAGLAAKRVPISYHYFIYGGTRVDRLATFKDYCVQMDAFMLANDSVCSYSAHDSVVYNTREQILSYLVNCDDTAGFYPIRIYGKRYSIQAAYDGRKIETVLYGDSDTTFYGNGATYLTFFKLLPE